MIVVRFLRYVGYCKIELCRVRWEFIVENRRLEWSKSGNKENLEMIVMYRWKMLVRVVG